MKKFIIICLCFVGVVGCSQPQVSNFVTIETNYGKIVLELNAEKAPITVANFLSYVDEDFYHDTVFHRVIPQFMIQGGGYSSDLKKKSGHAPIKNEAANGLKNLRGTIAMARTSVVDSATSEFFINHADNESLNHKVRDYGYAVFGKVIAGMDIVDKIAAVKTIRKNYVFANLPVDEVLVKSIVRGKP
jgi:cyclophilin family peptidyl-prolyl cis-trans isomerase